MLDSSPTGPGPTAQSSRNRKQRCGEDLRPRDVLVGRCGLTAERSSREGSTPLRRESNARRAVNRVFAFDDEAMALVNPHVDHRGDHRSSVADLHCEHGTYGGPTALAQLVDRSKSLSPSPRRTDSIPRRYSNKSRIAMTASSPGQGDLQTPTGAGPKPLMLDDRFGRRNTKSSTLPEDPHLSTLSSWAVVAASAGASPVTVS